MSVTPDRLAPTLVAAQADLLARLATDLGAERPVVVLAGAGATVPASMAASADAAVVQGPTWADGSLEAIVPGRSAVIWLGAPGAESEEPLLEVLAAAATAGSPVLIVVTADADADPSQAAARLAAALPGARVLEQRATEVAVIAEAGAAGPPVELPAAGALVTGYLVCCVPEDAAPAFAALIEPVATGVREEQLRAQERAVEELRTANVRLAREHLGRYDSAAASIVHRLEERYEREREIAIENDRLYQDARRRLAQPHHVAADKLVGLIKRIPGGAFAVRALKRLAGR